ncbi:hypothetical protein J3E72DRAFT_11754 [Bipolaris maydis]|uniref:uncharacterized protein n=1 Tax=Cochliobolus heterostrophus TaxID=5016 RepID=UPI0024D54AB1|nr:hypothetical protein J3E73DRAFT_6834 [Bipolaris maydis]KAJ5057276.1 hypothetical protein J3E74DRAFT_13022 [Bipolaris maydis]KAJ6194198.1 hypothetical protein J3E72DRAFT_11754 [Bipolaris maydis]KAJ6212772.1 hypothetical protein PSV09DRAFT_2029567 [Bipolaris maydis]KAJ6265235.1 hypothetical protein PSV08DRAFT_27856 [Bipolaris maydis]
MANSYKNRTPTPDPESLGGRPSIPESEGTRYTVGEKVFYTAPGQNAMKGPYLIASRPGSGQYTLCDENGNPVEGGVAVAESTLILCP